MNEGNPSESRALAQEAIIAPGQTLGSVTDKIASVIQAGKVRNDTKGV